ncbi:MAG TPA: XRE family transcriptional regulator, partial [Candidatus Acidoferrum sp.]|nr:XRE family transcriptional regulator [Candidatus Acidoferrum sp.]
IGQIVARRGLSQVKAAAVLGVDQPKVSAIVRGHLEKFSIERLCELLTRLGCDVDIRVQEKKKSARGRMRIQIAG